MSPADFTSKRVTSSDGVELNYYVAGTKGPWVVIAGGLGAGVTAWRHQLSYLGDKMRFLAWDYRGLYASDDRDVFDARKPGSSELVEAHVRDLHVLLDAEGVNGGLWMGWSFGAQVLMEMFRRDVPRPDCLVLINPCYGRRPQDSSGMRRLFVRALGACEWFPQTVDSVVRKASSWPETASWLKRFRFVGSSIDEDGLTEIVKQLRSVNSRVLLQSLQAAASHRIDGILGGVDVPTLVIVGERDAVTPRSNAEPLAKQIPHVELFVVRNGTHFVLLEFPELVNLRVEKFLREHSV
ncbi:MAG: alpha/beta hydrolase [Polyangiaceae bacterium]|nr:alpha/beta hydrolase [Polyangiaceae bacterium]